MKLKRTNLILIASLSTFIFLESGMKCSATENNIEVSTEVDVTTGTEVSTEVDVTTDTETTGTEVDVTTDTETTGTEVDVTTSEYKTTKESEEHKVVALNSGVKTKKKVKLGVGHYLVGTGVALILFVIIFSLFKKKPKEDDYEEDTFEEYDPHYYQDEDTRNEESYSYNEPTYSYNEPSYSNRNDSNNYNPFRDNTANQYHTRSEEVKPSESRNENKSTFLDDDYISSFDNDFWSTDSDKKSIFDDDYKSSLDTDFLSSLDNLFDDDDIF